MAHIFADRVKEGSLSTGTGPFELAGADPGFVTFGLALTTADTCYYVIEMDEYWEVGVGTFTAPSTLARTTILASSNGGAAVVWINGTKTVALTAPAEYFRTRSYTDAQLNASFTAVGHTHVENDITDLDKYTQNEVDTLHILVDGGYF